MYFYLPILTVVCSNVIYHICAKSISPKINTFASLAVTYVIGAALALAAYYLTSPTKKLTQELSYLNWATVVLAVAILGLEAGSILMYKVGWNISLGPLVASILLAVSLIFVGRLLYQETISLYQVAGIVLCLSGLILINQKA
ncbi:MAG: EamA family transporter [Lawsonibacter sp.]